MPRYGEAKWMQHNRGLIRDQISPWTPTWPFPHTLSIRWDFPILIFNVEGHSDDSVQHEMQIVFRNLSPHFACSTLFCVLHMIIAPHFSSNTVFASNRLNLQSLKSKMQWLWILSLIRFKSLINKAFFDCLQSKSAPEQSSTITNNQACKQRGKDELVSNAQFCSHHFIIVQFF